MGSKILSTTTVLALGVFVVSPVAAAVPTVADFAACNMKAAEEAAADTASASPRTAQTPRAGQLPADARPVPQAETPRNDVQTPPSAAGKAGASSVQRDPTGTTISSDKDAQVEGMAADRATDPAYVAAYRSCMRQRGF
jgi:hypothetical protein